MKKLGLGASPRVDEWNLSDFGDFYMRNRSSFLNYTRKCIGDSNRTEEILQEAMLKVMLASPELVSESHARAYVYRTIQNLSLDFFRAEAKKPKLILLDDINREGDLALVDQTISEHSEIVAAAEDAVIVRQALALLSPAERAALVMWEMEGRSTSEIAKELGIKESSVRHTVSRARSSLRRALSSIIVDEKRQLTALDLLSNTYRKSKDIAQKSGRVAMSLALLATAFLGFNSMTGSEPIQTAISSPVTHSKVSDNLPAIKAVVEVENTIEQKDLTPIPPQPYELTELEFLNAQLSSVAVMLETLQLIEGTE